MIKKLAEQLSAPAPVLDISAIRSDKWQRISPVSIIYFVIKFVTSAVRDSIQTFAFAPAAIIATTGDNRWIILAAFAVAAFAALIIGSTLSYMNFKFRIEGDRFLIRSGVFKRKRLSLSFDRIQNIALREPLYFRPFGLIILGLESAGSSSEEVSLAGIPRATGQAIRKHVLHYKDNAAPAPSTADDQTDISPPTKKEELLLAQPISELVRYGISNNNLWIFAGLTAAFFSQIDNWWESKFVIDTFDTVGAVIGTGLVAVSLLIITVMILILSVLLLASIAGAVIVNFNYRLSLQDERYHRTRGLFERQETSLPAVKIQNLQISEPFIAKLIKRAHITIGQIGFKSKQSSKRQQKFVIPSVREEFTKDLVQRVFGKTAILDLPLQKISYQFIIRHVVFSVLPMSIAVAALWATSAGWISIIALFTPLIALPFIMLRYKKYGYATDGDLGVVQNGILGTSKTVFSFHKVQTVELIRSPGQRRWGLATLKIKLAGSKLLIPYMPHADARLWRDIILLRIEKNNTPWM